MSSARTAPVEIRVGLGSCCQASGSAEVYRALCREVRVLRSPAAVRPGGCVGMCHNVPLVAFVRPDGTTRLYGRVTPGAVPGIVRRELSPAGPAAAAMDAARRGWRRLTRDEAWTPSESYRLDEAGPTVQAFLAPQVHIATAGYGRMDPTDLDEYRAAGGYEALERALRRMTPRQVIAAVADAGLRGRGGAGFPTGAKWELAARQPGPTRYVVCNGDEGDPGAFMDRMLLEAYPHRILEGAIIAAWAVGASEILFYVRQEYSLAVEHLSAAIAAAQTAGLLGERVMGTEFSVAARVVRGAGAFVCGEETALIASIEGRRGQPRLRPPYPAQAGLWGRPTLVNNVETLAAVPWILLNGPEAHARLGTPASRGTKVFALAGKVARGGLIEVPMGTTISRIVMGLGGGVRQGHSFKAVQIGGPSGGCIPAALADTPVDYEALTAVGAMMGSGGLVVLDETDCMVDIARYFLQFTQNESCGQCSLCRVGTRRMLEILSRLCNGQGRSADLCELEDLARQVRAASLCGLGRTAPNPVLTTLRYFREEYEAHLAGRCPAGRCAALVNYHVTDDCIGCTRCAAVCPVQAIEPRPYRRHAIDAAKCTCCHMCVQACPVDAIRWK